MDVHFTSCSFNHATRNRVGTIELFTILISNLLNCLPKALSNLIFNLLLQSIVSFDFNSFFGVFTTFSINTIKAPKSSARAYRLHTNRSTIVRTIGGIVHTVTCINTNVFIRKPEYRITRLSF